MNYFSNKIELNNRQRAIIGGEPNVIVKGLAGTGKTMTVVHLARSLAIDNRVAVIIFTLSLQRFLLECIDHENVEVLTSKSRLNNYDYIIVDEVQDFTLDEIGRIQDHSSKGLYFFWR